MIKGTILDLCSEDARHFFLRSKSYCDFSLPVYFDFQPLIDKLSGPGLMGESLPNKNDETWKAITDGLCKLEYDVVNYVLYTNKDGKIAWRPITLINPVAYVYIVKIITSAKSWSHIRKRFKKFQKNKDIICCSIPLVDGDTPSKADTIKGWYDNFEKMSIKLSLEYSCMINTDISNCYGSIYTHSIAWALHQKGRKKAKKDRRLILGNVVDRFFQSISYNQTNGIPQGSILTDFIAEIVLGYADLELSKKIKKDSTLAKQYKIIRYRDDYRIFAHNKTDAEKIARYLCEVLSELGMKLNEQKTYVSENIITDAQKSDKLYWRDLSESNYMDIRILQIHSMSEKYPNSGSVVKALMQYCEQMEDDNIIWNDLELISAVAVDIAYRNPRTYPYIVTILGKTTSLMNANEVDAIFKKIKKKLCVVPNSTHLDIWLQRLSKITNIRLDESNELCNYVSSYIEKGRNDLSKIWDISKFNNKSFNAIFKSTPIVNSDKMKTLDIYPNAEEIKVFKQYQ